MQFDEDGKVVEDGEEETEEETMVGRVDGHFDIGSDSLANAFLEGSEYLDNAVGEDDYEITGVVEREDINVVNWPGDNEDCQCDSCRTERAAPEDRISFSCSCGYDIIIITDFKDFQCPNCKKVISRDRVIGSNGNYVLLNIDKEDK